MAAIQDIHFTVRQRQVIDLIARGFSNIEIADELGISPRTAKAHADILRTKLGVPRRRQIPLAFRDATGVNPFEVLEPATSALDESRAQDQRSRG